MKRMLIGSSLTVVLLAGLGPAALAAPPMDGCARGFERWDTATEPYRADQAVDDAGNRNGYVCARRLGEGLSRQYGTELPIYLFVDDDLATGRA